MIPLLLESVGVVPHASQDVIERLLHPRQVWSLHRPPAKSPTEPGLERFWASAAKASDPARARTIAKARRGIPRPRWIIEAMAKARRGSKHTKATRAKMQAAHRRLGTRPSWLNAPWTAKEDWLVRTRPPAEVVKLTGRTLSAVKNRRQKLGIKVKRV